MTQVPGPIVTLLLAGALLAGCGSSGGGDGDDGKPAQQVQKTTTTRVEVVEGIKGGFDPRAIYEREAPGVVTVVALFGSGGIGSIIAGGDRGDAGLGSGFVLNGDGEIATNAHVITTGEAPNIRRAREVYVQFGDGNRVEAKIVGYDPNADIGLLKVDPQGLELHPLPLGSSENVKVGTPVAAMGSPFGEEQSLSVGVVSALDRDVGSLTDFQISGAVQTDAAINPGNSGGPLVDAEGKVIGVNQQIKSASGGGEGVGFAVPIDLVRRSVEKLRKHGRVDYAYLGVSSTTVYPQLARRFELGTDRGAWLQEATPGGPAAEAGLRGGGTQRTEFQAGRFSTGGDVVVRIEDVPIEDSNDLAAAVALFEPDQEVEVEYFRDGKKRTGKVTLGRRPSTVRPRPERP